MTFLDSQVGGFATRLKGWMCLVKHEALHGHGVHGGATGLVWPTTAHLTCSETTLPVHIWVLQTQG